MALTFDTNIKEELKKYQVTDNQEDEWSYLSPVDQETARKYQEFFNQKVFK